MGRTIFHTEHRPGNCYHALSKRTCPEDCRYGPNGEETNIEGSVEVVRTTGVVDNN